VRSLDDLPCQGRPAQLQVSVRRLFGTWAPCRRKIFAERLPGLAEVRARATCQFQGANSRWG
jgi:hypothetical protein